MQLLKQHILAPFFVFQVFSIACWMLDSYFTYPLFSLLSLLLIEANTVRTRQSNLLELRGVRNEEVLVDVYRDKQWRTVPSSKLVPGDLILVTSEILCPADLLVLSGRAVVNEAMLTGESTPQVKESIDCLPRDSRLDLGRDKRHVLFGGTRIEQILPAEQSSMYIPKKGVLAYVLSTGLGSSQGRLIRTILFASQRVAAESRDSMYLLAFLTVFAVAASSYVVYFGINNSTISAYRLIIEVILICTSTIPPDLPMELTLSVNSSLLALSKLMVFCTEPFRIPFAGTVSVCCFDKTGTITAEEYRLLGIDEMKEDAEEHTVDGVTGFLISDAELLKNSLIVVGGCHSLVRGVNGFLIGDSLEATAFTSLGFAQEQGKSRHKSRKLLITTIKTFHFSAELSRMSTIVAVGSPPRLFVLTKGAPEAVKRFLAHIPLN
jgi:cation-transporting ATPase 13A1